MKNAVQRLINDARESVEEREVANVDADELGNWVVLDVREDDEYAQGHLPGAISMPRSRLEMLAAQHPALADQPEQVLVCCASGMRSLLAAHTLQNLGLSNCVSLKGGFKAWQAAGRPVSQK